jgi:hypothetical protein
MSNIFGSFLRQLRHQFGVLGFFGDLFHNIPRRICQQLLSRLKETAQSARQWVQECKH